jgi:transcription antitermination factor NusA-like protein
VFIKDEYIQEGLASRSERDDIIKSTGIDSIHMDSKISVPEVPGQAMIIESRDIRNREMALRHVLENIERIDSNFKGKDFRGEIEVMTFIPEGLVALAIGHKGKLIHQIGEDTGVKMVINQRVVGMTFRSTFARGIPKQLARAVTIMYNTLEEQAYLIKDWDKIRTQSISREDIKLTAKFIVETDCCGFIIGKNGNFTKYLESSLGIYMRCDRDSENRILKPYQSICAMRGTLKDIQKGIKELCKRLEEYYKSVDKNFQRYPFNLVIPANYVTKIIGAGGCMVKNIAQLANGAQIKINSEKDSKKSIREVTVAINGSLEGKYKAAHLIIEQVEIFKNGGPVSKSSDIV